MIKRIFIGSRPLSTTCTGKRPIRNGQLDESYMGEKNRKNVQTGAITINNMSLSDEERNTKLEYGSLEAKSTIDTRPANLRIKTPQMNSHLMGRTFSKMTKMTKTLDVVFSQNRAFDVNSTSFKDQDHDALLSKKILVETNSSNVRRRRNYSKLSVDKNSFMKKNIDNIKYIERDVIT